MPWWCDNHMLNSSCNLFLLENKNEMCVFIKPSLGSDAVRVSVVSVAIKQSADIENSLGI